MIIRRGEVYKFRVSRKETEGTEQQKNRPAVIISTNRLNKKNFRFVAIPITSKKLEVIRPFEVPVMVTRIEKAKLYATKCECIMKVG